MSIREALISYRQSIGVRGRTVGGAWRDDRAGTDGRRIGDVVSAGVVAVEEIEHLETASRVTCSLAAAKRPSGM